MTKMKIILVIIIFSVIAQSGFLLSQETKTLGSRKAGLINLKGAIYFLENSDEITYQNVQNVKPVGYIYTQQIDFPLRDFKEGFPGVTDRFEYFGIVYTGYIELPTEGEYRWRLVSDDGSRLWIDENEIINNDGIHGEESVEAVSRLSKGLHKIKIWFFQGPAMQLGLQLFVTPPKSEEKIFNLNDFSASLISALKKVNAEITDEGIKIKLPDMILFDVGKADLQKSASETIKVLADIIKQYPEAGVKINGHTDNMGDEMSNQRLSEDRAKSVHSELIKYDLPSTAKIEAAGYGEKQPVASNNSEAGRAQNRRVELIILP